jgi:hypothetical protein
MYGYVEHTVSDFPCLISQERKMASVKIEKFVDGKHETSFRVPTFVLGMANSVLPKSALSSLANKGFHVQEILEAKQKRMAYTASVDVCEHGINKKIVVSLA